MRKLRAASNSRRLYEFVGVLLCVDETFVFYLFFYVRIRRQHRRIEAPDGNRVMMNHVENSPPQEKRSLQKRKNGMYIGKAGIAVLGKDVEWEFLPDEDAFHLPSAPIFSSTSREPTAGLVDWNDPCYAHAPRSPEEHSSNTKITCLHASRITDPGPCARNLGPALDNMRSAQAWVIAICALSGCRDVGGITASLDLMERVVVDMTPSELGQTGINFDMAIQEKRKTFPHLFNSSGE